MYGAGIPFHDSIVQRTAKPADFKLPGAWQECARLHLNVPFGTVAMLFVIKFNPNQTTILNALWDCSPNCCIVANGDTVCAGQDVQLGTDREAFGYTWTGPNGFTSKSQRTLLLPMLPLLMRAGITSKDLICLVVMDMILFMCRYMLLTLLFSQIQVRFAWARMRN